MLVFYTLFFLTGIFFTFMVFKNPDNFLKFFLAAIILGTGVKINGYPVLDEFWVLMLLLGLFLRKIFVKKFNFEKSEIKKFNLHEKAFIFLILYFLFQSLRGGIWLEDPRMLRWVIFFIIVGLSFLVFTNFNESLDPYYVAQIILYSTLIYFFLYFLSGYIYELITGMSKFGELQDLYIAGSSVATFPTVIFLIALIILNERNKIYNENIRNINFLIALSFIVVTFTLVYYDSRSGIFTIIGAISLNLIFQILKKNKRGKFQFFLIVSFIIGYQIWAVNYSESNRQIQDFLPIDEKLNFALPQNLAQQTEGKGRARMLEPKAAYNFIKEDLYHALFGYGWYMSRYELIEPIQQMRRYEQFIRLNLSKKKPYQASGAVAIMVDTGFIGLFLFLLNLILGFITILKSHSNSKYVVSIVYLSIILWSLVGTITPILLFYFWVMPNNPILLMLEKKEIKI